MPPDIRSKSWHRANARLAELRTAAYSCRYAQFRGQGMAPPKAYDRAIAAVRDANADLFARLLAEQYQLWHGPRRCRASRRGPAGGREEVRLAPAQVTPAGVVCLVRPAMPLRGLRAIAADARTAAGCTFPALPAALRRSAPLAMMAMPRRGH